MLLFSKCHFIINAKIHFIKIICSTLDGGLGKFDVRTNSAHS
ncbi:MAG: hypothetical protein ACI9NN_001685 [Bacteroidia bacterium]|jgi:hypothetical protein